MSQKILIPGGSGFLGRYLGKFFIPKGYEIYILSRGKAKVEDQMNFVHWDGETLGDWAVLMEEIDIVINMAGRTVNCRYTEENKRQILESRLHSTRVLGEAIQKAKNPPKIWFNSSSATIYQDTRGTTPANDEYEGKIGDDFSMGVCKQWEKVFNEAQMPHTRKIILRTAITLGMEGGALPPLVNMAKWGLGGTQAGGQQFVSWLHVEDFALIIDFLIQREKAEGVYNAAAPNPMLNQDFMRTLRKACGRSFGLPLMTWMLKLGAIMIKTETELLLKSRKVVSKRLEDEGFKFKYPTLKEALDDILNLKFKN